MLKGYDQIMLKLFQRLWSSDVLGYDQIMIKLGLAILTQDPYLWSCRKLSTNFRYIMALFFWNRHWCFDFSIGISPLCSGWIWLCTTNLRPKKHLCFHKMWHKSKLIKFNKNTFFSQISSLQTFVRILVVIVSRFLAVGMFLLLLAEISLQMFLPRDC